MSLRLSSFFHVSARVFEFPLDRASRSFVSQVYVESFFGVFSVMLAHVGVMLADVGALGSHLASKMSQDSAKMTQHSPFWLQDAPT